MSTQTFKRLEKKYIINKAQMNEIISFLKDNLVLDKHCINGTYNIYSIYYDTLNQDIIRYSVSHPAYKEKLRIRSYKENPNSDDLVFIELKRKFNGLGYKRRIELPFGKVKRFMNGDYFPFNENDKQYFIGKEILNHLKLFKDEPYIYISSNRIAYFDKSNPDFRITFDTSIKYRYKNLEFNSNKYDIENLKENEIIMEIKFKDSIPLYLSHKLSELKVYPHGYSKYGTIYKRKIGEKKND